MRAAHKTLHYPGEKFGPEDGARMPKMSSLKKDAPYMVDSVYRQTAVSDIAQSEAFIPDGGSWLHFWGIHARHANKANIWYPDGSAIPTPLLMVRAMKRPNGAGGIPSQLMGVAELRVDSPLK
jgi:prepilin-type processing-associated H-X9-DG protein